METALADTRQKGGNVSREAWVGIAVLLGCTLFVFGAASIAGVVFELHPPAYLGEVGEVVLPVLLTPVTEHPAITIAVWSFATIFFLIAWHKCRQPEI